MTSRKQELLSMIGQIQADLEIFEKEKEAAKADLSMYAPIEESVRAEYEKIKTQLDSLVKTMRELQLKASDNKTARERKAELERYKRELNRILDKEALDREFLERKNEFADKCLDALWRKENREDGQGAKPHQIEGAIHMAVVKQGVLADEAGLGKTLTSLIWSDFLDAKRIIAVVPKGTMGNFEREVNLWTPHRTPILLGDQPKNVRDMTLNMLTSMDEFIVILSYSSWRKDKELIEAVHRLNPDTLILDEAHHTKSTDTVACKGMFNIRFADNTCPACDDPDITRKVHSNQVSDRAECQNCGYSYKGKLEFSTVKHVLSMTGTPILNKPQELYPMVHVADPVGFPNVGSYLNDFCLMTRKRRWTWNYGGEKELVKKLGPRFLQRTQEDTDVIIPPNGIIEYRIDYEDVPDAQKSAYQQVRDFAQLVLDPEKGVAMSIAKFITVLLRLRQVITAPSGIEFDYKDLETEEVYHYKFDVSDAIKLDKAEMLVHKYLKKNKRIVIFSQFREPLHLLQERLGSRAVVYDGGTSDYVRKQIELDFDARTAPSHPRWDVALVNYKAGGEGLNLNAASVGILVDREWNPGKEQQAIHRYHRMGQTQDTVTYILEVEDTVDTWMAALIAEKASLIGGFEDEAELFRAAYDALKNGEM